MHSPNTSPSTTSTHTEIICTKCGKPGTVPFTPTPGRPVFCRDCFSRPAPNRAPSRPAARPAAVPNARKKMLAMGRKGHFMYDAKEILASTDGGVDEKDARAFLEAIFARGSRMSVEDAKAFLDEKTEEGGLVTAEQRERLGKLLEKYSFWR